MQFPHWQLGPNTLVLAEFDKGLLSIDVQKNFSEKKMMKSIKDLEKKLNDSIKKGTLTEEETWELEDKLQALNDSLVA